MELLKPDRADVLGELVANNPSHSQQEVHYGGCAVRQRQGRSWRSDRRHVENLKMWNSDFYWVLRKQTPIRLDQILPHESSFSWKAHRVSGVLLSTSADEEHNQTLLSAFHFLSSFRNAGKGTIVKEALVMGSTWRPTGEKEPNGGFHMATITGAHPPSEKCFRSNVSVCTGREIY